MIYQEKGQHKKDKKVVVIMIEGGIGDTLLSTPMIRVMRQKYPKEEYYLVVMAMYHEIFGYLDPLNPTDGDRIIPVNPNIDFLFSMRFKSRYFYSQWARNADKIYRQNPYIQSPQRHGPKHMASIWCDLHEVKLDKLKLDYFITLFEEAQTNQLFQLFDNPVVAIHPYGGANTVDNTKVTKNKDWEDNRWQVVVNWLVNRGYDVIQLGQIGEHVFDNVFSMVGHLGIRESISVIKNVNLFISIDSFIMHAAKAFDKTGIVLWGRTNPFRVGYTENYNIFKLHSCSEIFCGRPEGILFDISPNKSYFTPWECEHKNCMRAINVQDVYKGVVILEKGLTLDPAKFNR